MVWAEVLRLPTQGDAPNCKRELSDSAREELDRDSVFGFILRLLARVLT